MTTQCKLTFQAFAVPERRDMTLESNDIINVQELDLKQKTPPHIPGTCRPIVRDDVKALKEAGLGAVLLVTFRDESSITARNGINHVLVPIEEQAKLASKPAVLANV